MCIPIWLVALIALAILILVVIAAVAAASVHRSEALITQLELRVQSLQRANKERADASMGRLVRP